MYKCNDCDSTFEEPRTKKTSYELFYGVSNEISSNTPLLLEVCPYCGSDDIEESEEEYE